MTMDKDLIQRLADAAGTRYLVCDARLFTPDQLMNFASLIAEEAAKVVEDWRKKLASAIRAKFTKE